MIQSNSSLEDNLKTWYNDTILSIEEMNEFLNDCKSFSEFQNDEKLNVL